ncbi:hypothetical protein GCM10007160_40170 [Litchfieldella qijiaojingensis]|uniref:STAS domain-containing protein n=2 Tax=Litchfieldella qijiaojingensis TaxID=980347 RepID=A0ABQ2ZCH6_9GAMM|nr:hypothetical protein GCM10007160_40170 [Halomonas qijiaojingensis]
MTVKLEGTLGLRNVQQVCRSLEEVLESGKTVAVDVREVVEVDISVLQLLIAARVSAMQRGAELRLVTARGDAVQTAMERAGLLEAQQ